MRKISCTRMELLAHKTQISLAQQGRDLLEQKRTALMKELLRVADTILEHSEALRHASAEARSALVRAETTAGAEAVKSAGLAARGELSLDITTANVMGVRFPRVEQKRISRSTLGRGFSIVGTSITIDETAEAFEAQVEAIIRLAQSELYLTRLADEIQQTSRRLNALDQLIIPELETERDFIQMVLDERERTDHFRFKLVKRILERKRT